MTLAAIRSYSHRIHFNATQIFASVWNIPAFLFPFQYLVPDRRLNRDQQWMKYDFLPLGSSSLEKHTHEEPFFFPLPAPQGRLSPAVFSETYISLLQFFHKSASRQKHHRLEILLQRQNPPLQPKSLRESHSEKIQNESLCISVRVRRSVKDFLAPAHKKMWQKNLKLKLQMIHFHSNLHRKNLESRLLYMALSKYWISRPWTLADSSDSHDSSPPIQKSYKMLKLNNNSFLSGSKSVSIKASNRRETSHKSRASCLWLVFHDVDLCWGPTSGSYMESESLEQNLLIQNPIIEFLLINFFYQLQRKLCETLLKAKILQNKTVLSGVPIANQLFISHSLTPFTYRRIKGIIEQCGSTLTLFWLNYDSKQTPAPAAQFVLFH